MGNRAPLVAIATTVSAVAQAGTIRVPGDQPDIGAAARGRRPRRGRDHRLPRQPHAHPGLNRPERTLILGNQVEGQVPDGFTLFDPRRWSSAGVLLLPDTRLSAVLLNDAAGNERGVVVDGPGAADGDGLWVTANTGSVLIDAQQPE